MTEINKKAPGFSLPDQNGNIRTLDEFKGRTVVLYFYSKDNTSGCTRQAQGFGELNARFAEKNAVVIGVSKDSVASHSRFAEKYALPFILLSDPELDAIKAYGVYGEKKLYGKVSMGVVRSTFVIGPDGILTAVMCKVKADTNPADTLNVL